MIKALSFCTFVDEAILFFFAFRRLLLILWYLKKVMMTAIAFFFKVNVIWRLPLRRLQMKAVSICVNSTTFFEEKMGFQVFREDFFFTIKANRQLYSTNALLPRLQLDFIIIVTCEVYQYLEVTLIENWMIRFFR